MGGGTLSSFYLKRYMRLFPLLLSSVVVYDVLAALYKSSYEVPFMGKDISLWGSIATVLGIQSGWASKNPYINNPLWYISVLLLCYVVFYFIVYISKRINVPYVYGFIIMVFIGLGINSYKMDYMFLNSYSARGYYAFFGGLLLAHFTSEKVIKYRHYLLCIAIILSLTYMIVKHTAFMSPGIKYTMTFLYFPALIILFKAPLINRLLSFRFVECMGSVSFNVYVWHLPVLVATYVCISKFSWAIDFDNRKTMFMYAIICFAIGIISHFILEKPAKKYVNAHILKK